MQSLRQIPAVILALLLELPVCSATGAERSITFAVLDSCRMPICDFREAGTHQELSGGLMKDWYEALASEMGRNVEMRYLSRKRLEDPEAELHFDADCFLAPEWVAHADRYDWLPPFLFMEDQLVSLPHTPPVYSLSELAGKRIGYVHGYVYPTLERLFSAGLAVREEAPNEQSQLIKQLQGRSDYAVFNSLRLHYLRTNDPAIAKLNVSPLSVGHVQQSCRRTRHRDRIDSCD